MALAPFALTPLRSSRSVPVTLNQTVIRGSEHFQYQPTIWNYDHLEDSLRSSFMGEAYTNKKATLIRDVRVMLEKPVGSLAQFEMIDALQRLGICHLFKEEINTSLEDMYNCKNSFFNNELYGTGLAFRIFRQHGFQVSQEVLDEAISFSSKHLRDHLKRANIEPNLAAQVSRSLEVPLHWRMQRSEARWYMDVYEKEENMNPALAQLAKMDFNMLQATFQRDLRNMMRWWTNLGVATKLTFARDRLVESFLASTGIAYEPQYARCREWLTKVMKFVLIIDDVYDMYASLDELELFTDAVERWDYKAMEKLPQYMKICYLALYNTTNDMAYDILKEQGFDILPYLARSWANFIKAMLVEAKWCHTSYTPSLQEFLDNGWISSSGSVFLVHAFFATQQEITSEALEGLDKNHDLLYCTSMMARLSNDLATSSAELERGDIASSVYCYMIEENASVGDARNHVRGLIRDTWKKLNSSIFESPFDPAFVNLAVNLVRTCLFVYQYGDGLGVEASQSKNHVLSLIVNPVEVEFNNSNC
ncbi:(-)-alpha-terpineol synthase [Thalictrum thalictroides]|uniref:(-)-alpha-terpineol synthase n=1 Tax=Thalictrum thalictroides TaxID=46969 RepID=A0A7J6W9W1_THATH|nr:(-)-alpha-terpineol synthase [Thalictrum thalictroides]